MSKVVLQAGKEKSVLRQHPWIFSGAIESKPDFEAGAILPVYSAAGDFLAQAYFHPSNSIAGRILSFAEGPIEEIVRQKLKSAVELRKKFFSGPETNAYRLINAEGDGLPGLVADFYNGVVVIQISTYGMEKLKPFIVSALADIVKPRSIYEKSLSSARRQEGLNDFEGLLFGKSVDEVEILENGLRFIVDIEDGQKTGFFLDQREMRKKIGELSRGKKVLNCFSYSAGFSLFALKGGAIAVDSVESCAKACRLAEKNTSLNGFAANQHRVFAQDVFEFLQKSPLDYGLVVLDPPAFAKKRGDVPHACNGYKEINRLVLKKIPSGSVLFTSSCSQHIDEALFQNLIFQTALEAGREVKIIGRHLFAADHPVSIYHPEGEYLKSLILFVS